MGGYVFGFEVGVEVLGLIGVAGVGFLEAWWTHPRPPVQRGRIHRSHVEHSRCPYCHEALERDEDAPADEDAADLATLSCAVCKVVHHAVCWHGHGGCSVYGCRPDERPRRAGRQRIPAG